MRLVRNAAALNGPDRRSLIGGTALGSKFSGKVPDDDFARLFLLSRFLDQYMCATDACGRWCGQQQQPRIFVTRVCIAMHFSIIFHEHNNFFGGRFPCSQ